MSVREEQIEQLGIIEHERSLKWDIGTSCVSVSEHISLY